MEMKSKSAGLQDATKSALRMDYKSSGVNIELGNDASKVLYEASKQTWKNREGKLGEVYEAFEDFSGTRAYKVGGLPKDTLSNINFDGVGTKIELAERLEEHDTVAFDLFAMVCDDAVVRGAEPVVIGSVLDVQSLGNDQNPHINLVKQLAEGYINAAREAGVAILNGEIAELGYRVQGYKVHDHDERFNYNWSAGGVWYVREKKLISGKKVKPGDYLVGLRERGFRSNGFSLLRRALIQIYGEDWHKEELEDKNITELALTPSTIYAPTIVEMVGDIETDPRVKIRGIAHITGGGIPEKLGRMLRPSGFGAYLFDLFEPNPLTYHLQEKVGITDRNAYKTWNMGTGMILATPQPEKAIKIARKHGKEAKVIGVVRKTPTIEIVNGGFHRSPRILMFDLEGNHIGSTLR